MSIRLDVLLERDRGSNGAMEISTFTLVQGRISIFHEVIDGLEAFIIVFALILVSCNRRYSYRICSLRTRLNERHREYALDKSGR